MIFLLFCDAALLRCCAAGEVAPDAGDARVCGHSLRDDAPAAHQLLGYCPQDRYFYTMKTLPGAAFSWHHHFLSPRRPTPSASSPDFPPTHRPPHPPPSFTRSALPAQMTGLEVMRLYARLRGLPERLVTPEARRLLKALGLGGEAAGRACGSYSGGNRRKLSVAVALVGGAQVALLDEPSTGMDPGGWAGVECGRLL